MTALSSGQALGNPRVGNGVLEIVEWEPACDIDPALRSSGGLGGGGRDGHKPPILPDLRRPAERQGQQADSDQLVALPPLHVQEPLIIESRRAEADLDLVRRSHERF